jgi:transcriptional regulator GlxA family with amidase domain
VGVVVACGRIQVTYGGGGPGLFDRLEEAMVLDFSDSPPMRATFESLVAEFGTGEPASSAMMTELMNQCLISVFRRLSDHSDPLPWLSALEDPSLGPVLDTMLERPERPHSLETLAELANMSRSVFARRFHECFDRTPMDYLRDVRLRRAARLLHRADLSVNDVASKVGFASRSHFSRAFRDHFGCAPADFREA